MSTLKANNFQNIDGNEAFDITSGYLNLPAGTTTTPQIKFTAGSLLTTPQDGTFAYDGYGFYATPHAESGRGFVEISHFYKLTSNRTLSNVNTAQSLFGVGITIATGVTYEFEMIFSANTTGATSNSLGLSFLGTASLASIQYLATATNGTSATTPNAALSTFVSTAANTNITAAVAAATQRVCLVKGTVNVTTGGTFIPNITYSAAPGAAPSILAGAFIKVKPLNEITDNSVGQWA